jgi:hypothetical protein
MKQKPRAPEHEKIEEAMQQLKALGISGVKLEHPEQAVYSALVHLWQLHRRPPTIAELSVETGLESWKTRHAVSCLNRDGRAIRIRRGIYVPVVGQN